VKTGYDIVCCYIKDGVGGCEDGIWNGP